MHDVIIIGAGPAGLSTAFWCDDLGLDTLVLEQAEQLGGQLHRVYNPIENYLGVKARNGEELLDLFIRAHRRIERCPTWHPARPSPQLSPRSTGKRK